MKIRSYLYAALAAVPFVPPTKAGTGFTGEFDYQNFQFYSGGGAEWADVSSSPTVISLTGPEAFSGSTSGSSYYASILESYSISFDWAYSTTSLDPADTQAGWIAGADYIQLSDDAGAQSQSGSVTHTISGGWFGFFALSDNESGLASGQGTISITNFSYTLIPGPTSVWTGAESSSWSESANWDATVPDGTIARAEFGPSGRTSVSVDAEIDLGQMHFTADAASYTVDVEQYGGRLNLWRAGIINDSGATQTINNRNAVAFWSSATAGDVTINNIDGGMLEFYGSSSAGDAAITNSGDSSLFFNDNSSAGNAVIQNEGSMYFTGNASAGNATITTKGMSSAFYDNATGGTATINIDGGFLSFTGYSTSGSATINNDAGGLFYYHDSTADGTTINLLRYSGLTLEHLTVSTLRVGALSGTEESYITLSGKNLTIGGLNTSTILASEIYDEGLGGSLTKVGTGTLTLSGSNAFGGGLRINQGTVEAQSSVHALGSGTVRLAGGNLALAGDTGLDFGRSTLISQSGTIMSSRLTAGSGATHTLGALSIGAQTLTLGRGANVTSGTAGLGFGAVSLTGNATFSAEAGTLLTLASVANPSGAGRSFTVTGAGDTAITGPITTGTGRLTKSGSGQLTLSGSGSYSGGTQLNAGTLSVGNDRALGTGFVNVSGGTLLIGEGISITNTVTLSGGTYVKHLGSEASLAGAITAGSSFAGGNPDTTFTLLAGTTSGTTTLTATFSDAGDALVRSDILSFSGVNVVSGSETDLFVLQLSLTSIDPGSYLAWQNGSDEWVNAALGNTGNNAYGAQLGYAGSFASFQSAYGTSLEDYVGAWGFTETGVWAVLNHNSDFAVVPEPATVVLFGLSGAFLLGRLRRRGR